MSTELRVLILEDDPHDAELQISILKEAGYECLWRRVETQAAFLECLDGQAYDLILADYNLPTFDGLTALRLFLERDADIPFILVSGTLGEETAIESLRAGATDYVLKEGLTRLAPVVERALHDKEEQRQLDLAQEALRESEKKYRLLADNVTDVIWILDSFNLKFTYVSPSVEYLQGYTPDELMKMPLAEILSPPSFKLVFEIIAEELALEETGKVNPLRSRMMELEVYCKEGRTIPIEVTASFIRDETGKAVSIVGVSRGISERKQAERERQNLETQLRQAQKMEAIGTLAGGIAHDFNNILAAIIGFVELTMNQVEKGSRPFGNLQEVLQAANRAKNLVQQILTFSRQAAQELKPVQVGLIAKEVLKFLRASLPTTIEIDQEIRSDALVMADPTQIHQVLMNLASNSEHAMREKGGVLQVKLLDAKLDKNFVADHPELKPGPHLKLSVADTGPGIPAQMLHQIFDPFFTTKAKSEGTGMGLSIVHGIVGGYGGKISAASEPGKGTTFEVYLPVIETQAEPQTEVAEPIPTGTERILFVDDEPTLAYLGKQILESLGYAVDVRTSSLEALELLKAQPERFDLVITDMTMPKLTGDDLAREVLRIRLDLPVILCTGFSSNIDSKKAMAIGIRALISKPMLKREIAETVRDVLDTI